MTGPEHIFDAKDGGLLYAMSDGGDVSKLNQGLGEVYEILNMDMKPYPCCRSATAAIDGIMETGSQMERLHGTANSELSRRQKFWRSRPGNRD